MQNTSPWQVWIILGGVAFSAYFAYHYMHGSRGLSQKKLLEHAIIQHQITLQHLEQQRQRLEERAQMLNPANPDADMLDEIARRTLGLYEADEKVILLPKRSLDIAPQ